MKTHIADPARIGMTACGRRHPVSIYGTKKPRKITCVACRHVMDSRKRKAKS